jgi:hypothetical protein
MAPAPNSEAAYRKDEKTFCFHHELLYEAKVTDVRPLDENDKKSGFQYKVHYKGWKNTYVSFSVISVCFACTELSVTKVTFALARTPAVESLLCTRLTTHLNTHKPSSFSLHMVLSPVQVANLRQLG